MLGRVSDPMSGYFMVRRRAIADVVLSPLGYKILVEVIGRAASGGSPRSATSSASGPKARARSRGTSTPATCGTSLRLRVATLRSSRFFKFAVVGGSGVLVDMAMLFLLSDPSALGLGLTRSKIAAAELAIINNFLWNDAWTFSDMVRTRSWAHKLRRLAKFNVVCGIGLVLNVVLLNLMFNLLHMDRYVANLIAIAGVTAWNFWINLKVSWSGTGASR